MSILQYGVADGLNLPYDSSEEQYGQICHKFGIAIFTLILVVELSLPFRLLLRIFWFSKKTWLGIKGLELGIDR